MEENRSDDIEVYLVWSPELGAEERHVPEAAELIPDPRVRHYWDGDGVLGRRYAEQMDMTGSAWDMWFLFARDTEWADPEGVAEPDWWEHQLGGLPDSLRLDPERFARKAAELLEEGG